MNVRTYFNLLDLCDACGAAAANAEHVNWDRSNESDTNDITALAQIGEIRRPSASGHRCGGGGVCGRGRGKAPPPPPPITRFGPRRILGACDDRDWVGRGRESRGEGG